MNESTRRIGKLAALATIAVAAVVATTVAAPAAGAATVAQGGTASAGATSASLAEALRTGRYTTAPGTQTTMQSAQFGVDAPASGADSPQLSHRPQPRWAWTSAGFLSSVNAQVGRLFMWSYSNSRWVRASSCSGAVVSRTLVLTAAHCMSYNGVFWAGYSFVPGTLGTTAPYGEFVASGSKASYDAGFKNSSTPWAFDYGFVKLDVLNGRFVGDVVGTAPVRVNLQGRTFDIASVGYPAEGMYVNANGSGCRAGSMGCRPWRCASPMRSRRTWGNGYESIGWGCRSNGGVSGGPVFGRFGDSWYIVSVNSTSGYVFNNQNQEVTSSCRTNCARWYMENSWGPLFVKSRYDQVIAYAANR